nr:immunoglobulin light chain junction region [Macaca mulatta]MPO03651.1 immunoglobulin light chain junction region [Macaca mulatta]MPO04426.1 immunoglobulin light chain junction region [Macaca mulatta]MPO04729.1 immunoglobulin light chain junction region [Macaca mulatta]MPO04789.1 immunoglobulin light chain junction region [Macaca mulatta]
CSAWDSSMSSHSF